MEDEITLSPAIFSSLRKGTKLCDENGATNRTVVHLDKSFVLLEDARGHVSQLSEAKFNRRKWYVDKRRMR